MIRVVGGDGTSFLRWKIWGCRNGKEPGGDTVGYGFVSLLLHRRLGLRPVGRRYRKAECLHKNLNK